MIYNFFSFKDYSYLLAEFEYRVERVQYLMNRHKSQTPQELLASFIQNQNIITGEDRVKFRQKQQHQAA